MRAQMVCVPLASVNSTPCRLNLPGTVFELLENHLLGDGVREYVELGPLEDAVVVLG